MAMKLFCRRLWSSEQFISTHLCVYEWLDHIAHHHCSATTPFEIAWYMPDNSWLAAKWCQNGRIVSKNVYFYRKTRLLSVLRRTPLYNPLPVTPSSSVTSSAPVNPTTASLTVTPSPLPSSEKGASLPPHQSHQMSKSWAEIPRKSLHWFLGLG